MDSSPSMPHPLLRMVSLHVKQCSSEQGLYPIHTAHSSALSTENCILFAHVGAKVNSSCGMIVWSLIHAVVLQKILVQ